jgi:hypothetical protein
MGQIGGRRQWTKTACTHLGSKRIVRAGTFLPLGESEMSEPMIEEAETEEFTDELSDEALDRESCRDFFCTKTVQCRAGIVAIAVPVTDR